MEDPDVDFSETLTLSLKAAESYWYQADVESATALLEQVFTHSRSILDRVPAHILQSRVLGRRGQGPVAIKLLEQCLNELGVEISDTTWEDCDEDFQVLLREVRSADLKHLLSRPQSQDVRLQAIGSVLTEAMAHGFWSSHLLFYQLTLLEVRIFLNEGTLAQSGLAFVHFAAICIGRWNKVKYGYSLGNIALQIFDNNPDDLYHTGRGLTLYCMLVGPFGQSYTTLIPRMEHCLSTCLSSGDRFSALLVGGHLAASKLWSSQDLVDVENFCKSTHTSK